MDQKEIEFLIKEGEGLTVEFREKYTPRMDQDMVAFANTKGGKLLLGVEDDNKVVGFKLTNEIRARIMDLARNCHPSIRISMKQAGPIAVIDIPEGSEKPYSCSDGYYRRLDASSPKMSPGEVKTFFRETVDVFFEGLPRKDVSLDDISLTKIKAFLKKTQTSLKVTKANLIPFLTSLRVYENGSITNAGILMFDRHVARHVHHAESILVAYKGTDKNHIYDRLDVKDDLLTQYHQAEVFLKKHLNIRSEITGFRRSDIYELPLNALREALVNALVHRDYSLRGTSIYVEVYDDRVEIVNPGGLPRGLDKKSFQHTSIRRNEIIADLFNRMEEMERTGSGIKKMKDAMRNASLKPPVFKPDTFFHAIFYRDPRYSLKHPAAKGLDKVLERVLERVTENQRQIIKLIRSNTFITNQELSKKVGISERKIRTNIKKLKGAGILVRIGADRGGHWQVME